MDSPIDEQVNEIDGEESEDRTRRTDGDDARHEHGAEKVAADSRHEIHKRQTEGTKSSFGLNSNDQLRIQIQYQMQETNVKEDCRQQSPNLTRLRKMANFR
jgi:hypothetical protein